MSLRMTLMTAIALCCALPALANAGPGGKRGEPVSKEDSLTRVVYPVAELIVPILDHGDEKTPATQEEQAAPGAHAKKAPGATLENELMDLIRTKIQPNSWKEMGGAGSLQYYPLGMALVVNQSAAVQAEVADLVRALRRLQDVEVGVETRIVQVPPEVAARFRDKVKFAPIKAENGETFVALGTPFCLKSAGKMETVGFGQDTALFTDKEVFFWLNLFQDDRATNIMQAPKITMANGQRAFLTISTRQTFVTEYKIARDKDKLTVVPKNEEVDVGLKSTFLPTVSADRRSVRLAVDFRNTAILGSAAEVPVAIKVGADKEFRGTVQIPQVETVTCKQTCVIPDGQTMVVSLGQVMVDARTEFPSEFVSRLPYLSRLLRNVGYSREAREVFLLITPRVIINEEEEQIFQGNTLPIPRQ